MTGKGHVPEVYLPRYRRIRGLAQLMDTMGGTVSGLGQYDDANTLWALSSKYKQLANELRVDVPEPSEEEHD